MLPLCCISTVFSAIFPSDRLSAASQVSSERSSGVPPRKDASTETDSELTSLVHLTRTDETDSGGEQRLLSSDCSEAGSDDDSDEEVNEKPSKWSGRGTSGGRRKAAADSLQPVGQSCCRVCGKFFRYRRSFVKHLLQHERSSKLCGACGKHLGSGESLKAHLQSHSEENICGDPANDGQLEVELSDAERRVDDSDWKDSEGSEDEKKDGFQVRNEGPDKAKGPKSPLKYRCKVCGRTFSYRAPFLKHVQEDERDTDICGVCGERFESEEILRLHLQTYIRTNDCEVCGKHFDGHKQLEMHMRTHTGEKPYVCAVCGKAFAQNGNLMGHMRAHTGERPYVCSVCGQSFGFKEYMMAHMRIHTGEKPFLCSVCGKGFRQRGTLKTHMMIHTGECAHRCGVCDKSFYKSGALKIHMRSHTGEKPYLCTVCGKSFTAGGALTKHMGVHKGEHMAGRALAKRLTRTHQVGHTAEQTLM